MLPSGNHATRDAGPRRRRVVVRTAVAVLTALAVAVPAAAAWSRPGDPTPDPAPLEELVTRGDVKQHLGAFQSIADDNGGDRASGTSGFDASARYVADVLERAGDEPRLQSFEFPFFSVSDSL